jgi:hypothetical protein
MMSYAINNFLTQVGLKQDFQRWANISYLKMLVDNFATNNLKSVGQTLRRLLYWTDKLPGVP